MTKEINYFAEAGKYNTVKLQELHNVEENSPQYRNRFRWTERHLQCIWFDESYRPSELRLSSGENITVIDPGSWNLEAGPDFINAKIMVNPGSRILSGDVEIHIYPTGWDHHRHSLNSDYDNVILHVSWFNTPHAKTLPPNTLTLSLSEKMLARPWIALDDIDIKAYPHNTLPKTPRPCQIFLESHPDYAEAILLAAGYHRMQNKALTIARQLEDRADREQIFYEEFMSALGYKNNKLAFRALAKHIPLSLLKESRDHNLALLLGCAGLLAQADTIQDPEASAYVRSLWDIWWKSELETMPEEIGWTLHGLRPSNHPVRRLAAAAALFSGKPDMMHRFDQINPKGSGKIWIDQILNIIHASCQWPFWNTHLLFGSTPKEKQSYTLLGAKRSSAILTNVIIPFYAAEKRVPLNTFKNIPPEDISSPMKTAAFYLLGRDHNPAFYSKNNLLQQGLLQIYLDFCLPARSSCEECRLYERIKADLGSS